tara:strand:- start:901 stop:1209 length:309 start_codon:yes stop_codon:yes gene_type:complete
MSNVGFKPNGTNVLVKVPQSYYDKENERATILNKAQKDTMRNDYIKQGDKLEVVATSGEEGLFCEVGDLISINATRHFNLELDGIEEPFIVIRDGEAIGKFV